MTAWSGQMTPDGTLDAGAPWVDPERDELTVAPVTVARGELGPRTVHPRDLIGRSLGEAPSCWRAFASSRWKTRVTPPTRKARSPSRSPTSTGSREFVQVAAVRRP